MGLPSCFLAPLSASCSTTHTQLSAADMPTAITPRIVLISGVSGFLGTATTLEFLKKGWKGALQTSPLQFGRMS